MSTITAQVTTTVSAIPLLRHRDTVVVFPADQDDFVSKYEATNDHLSVSTVPQINAVGNEIDIVTGQINVVAGEVNTNAGIATTKATLATDYAEKMALEVETGTYSSKEHAIGDLTTTGGSAKAWAVDTASPDGTTSKSAKTLAAEAASSAANALSSENAAAISAANAAALAGAFVGTSTTSLLIELGSKSFTTQLNEQYTAGIWMIASSQANPANYMFGQVVSYIPSTGALVINVTTIGGSGTFADWNLSLTGIPGATGPQGPAGTTFTGGSLTSALNEARATVASHATTADIWGALGNQIDWTGTATTTGFPNAPQAGATRDLICAGACSFTAGANMLIDGVTSGNTVLCAIGDTVIVRAISTTQFKLTRLVSKDQFKTINGNQIIGSGDISISSSPVLPFISNTIGTNEVISPNTIHTGVSTYILPPNTVFYRPFMLGEDTSISALMSYITVADTGNMILGIYSSDANLLPNSKLSETAAMSTGTTGMKEGSITPITLNKGVVYYLAATHSAAGNISFHGTFGGNFLGYLSTTTVVSVFNGFTEVGTILPATATPSAMGSSSVSQVQAIYLRKA